MEYAHKTSELKVGKYYMVAHAEIKSTTGNVWGYVPIIPIKHKDDFAAHIPAHYHLDMRFRLSDHVYHFYKVENNKSVIPVIDNDNYGFYITKIVFKKKKCRNLQTGLLLKGQITEEPFLDWFESMKGKSCVGQVCPHFKAKMNLIDGQLVCPMHGLKGDPVTEIII